ncbi:odorant receptor 131-2-like [Clupea harengus]|uniref:Odorant receptor 131-2-like n=1 Tax=Clupea harengus TaxID=7950 RepID=A0A6P3W280_CLUHA|nr:odorant receptor 131-2-like [Clupea harengus]
MANASGPMSVVEMQAFRITITDERIFKMFLILFTHVLFIYINIVMMVTLRSKATFGETARYILFGHMLLNDTLHLGVGLVLYVLGAFYITLMRAACAFLVLLSATTFTIAPLNLAVMSLERYVAVCFPLHHCQLATPGRTRLAIPLVWAAGCVNVLTDVCVLFLGEPAFYLAPTVCTIEQLLVAPWQGTKALALNTLLFVSVAILILYTYVAILVEARSASSDKASTHKALKTVLLHAFQLGLSLMSFVYVFLESLASQLPVAVYVQLRFLNFFVVLILPRCLSSLVYGLRDEAFKPLFKQHFFFCGSFTKVGPQ